MYENICPKCHAHLDPGEKCDCTEERKAEESKRERDHAAIQKMLILDKDGQFRLSVQGVRNVRQK